MSVFDILIQAGYVRFMFYSNVGDYILTLTANDRSALEDVSWWLAQRRNRDRFPPAYADVCAIGEKDISIGEHVQRMEYSDRISPESIRNQFENSETFAATQMQRMSEPQESKSGDFCDGTNIETTQ